MSTSTSTSDAPYFLGLDASTQALKASLLSSDLDIISELAVNFDTDLPHYGTKGGVHKGADGEVNSPVLMAIEAFDVLFERIKKKGWDVARVRGVSAAGQQHASTYWNHDAPSILSNISGSEPLMPQLRNAFSRQVVPNWQDSSTTSECQAIETALGGAEAVARITGSKAHERFTGPQIMRWKRLHPDEWAETSRISLVSSYITTLLCLDGEIKGIDESDVCGMNMWTMNTTERGWNGDILKVVAGCGEDDQSDARKLGEMLGEVERDGGKCVGKIGKWFVDRWGFDPECCVFPGTGDNPATFLSQTLQTSHGLISLGTSDVVLVSTDHYVPDPEYHAFFHPAQIPHDAGGNELRYFNMLVYKNGSLAREHIRDQYYHKSWDEFNAAAEAQRPKSAADLPKQVGFYWLLPDIIPTNAHGTYKYLTSPSTSASHSKISQVAEFSDPSTNALTILESQFLNYTTRSSSVLGNGPSAKLSRVYATGGASANGTILSLAADIFGCPIAKNVEYKEGQGWISAHWNACSVGAAYKARWGWERLSAPEGQRIKSFDDVVNGCRAARRQAREHQPASAKDESKRINGNGNGNGHVNGNGHANGNGASEDGNVEEGVRLVALPTEGPAAAYAQCGEWWRQMEKRALSDKEI